MKDDAVYIHQILDAVSKIKAFTKDMPKEIFIGDQKTQSAVIMQLILIGELSKKISPEKKKMADLPWKDIAGFRNRAIHDYFGIDLEVVWNTLETDIPVLIKQLQAIIK